MKRHKPHSQGEPAASAQRDVESRAEAATESVEKMPAEHAYGVIVMREKNIIKWLRVRVGTDGVAPLNSQWEASGAVTWNEDVGALGIGRVEEAAVKACLGREYGGPQ